MLNLTQDPSILQITDAIRKKAEKGQYIISDVICRADGQEYQFVDLVMEGGGTLGIALVGYMHALEQAGVRFLGMGGSSVGAIVALLAYGCGRRLETRGEKLAAIIGEMNLGEMVDGTRAARKLSVLLGSRSARLRTVRIVCNALLSAPVLLKKIGLNPGNELHEWISDHLSDNGISTLANLNELIQALPDGLIHRETGAPIIGYDTGLRIVAADITTSTKVVFPDMAEMYWQNPDEINPACFARASASIPAFFQPFIVDGISGLIENGEKWERLGSFTGTLPDKVSFADGGLLSNFPIDLFRRPGIPRAPTLGARLGNKYRTAHNIEKIGQYAAQLFNALRHYADYDFIFKNPLYRQVIAHISTDAYHWLDFNMSQSDKTGLFREGVIAGQKFLDSFDWRRYKELRAAELSFYHAQTNAMTTAP